MKSFTWRLVILGAFVSSASFAAPRAVPAEWKLMAERGRYAIATAQPIDGLFPSWSNGFLAGDAGCSNVTRPPTSGGSCGRVYLAGVYNNLTYYDDDGAGTFPQRAAIANPFAVTVAGKAEFVASALDLELGKILNRSWVPCGEGGDGIEVELATWAHQRDRHLLIFEVRALNLSTSSCEGSGILRVNLASCSIDLEGTSEDFFVQAREEANRSVISWQLEVRAMESPPGGSSIPSWPATRAGVAFETLPSTLVLTAASPTARFHSVFTSSLEKHPWYTPTQEFRNSSGDDRSNERSGYPNPREEADRALAELVHNSGPVRGVLEPPDTAVLCAWAASDAAHAAAWGSVWRGGVEVEGNATMALAVNASVYALVASLRADWPLGASPGGLSRNAYEVRLQHTA